MKAREINPAKKLEELLINGTGSKEIAKKFNLEIEKLNEFIFSTFKYGTAKAFWKRIMKNDRRLGKKDMEEEKVLTLEELKEAEKVQQAKTAEQEIRVKATISEYRDILKEVTEKKECVSAMLKKIEEIRKSIGELSVKAENILEQHDNELKRLHEEQKSLDVIRNEIVARQVIYVFATKDGNIRGERDGENVELLFGDWHAAVDKLSKEYFNLLTKLSFLQVVQLAKIMTLEGECEYKIMFGQPELEEVFSKVKS